MAYVKQEWVDNDPTKTLSATRMTHIEEGIEAAHELTGGEVTQVEFDAVEARVDALEEGGGSSIVYTNSGDPIPDAGEYAEGTLWIEIIE
jgi:hypothetical protein